MARNQEPESKYTDSSEPLFKMYCKMTEHYHEIAEGSLQMVDNVVFFMGLFSAVVAALLVLTVPDLKQDPLDRPTFYLENIYNLQILADSKASLPSTPAQPSQFSAPKYAIWVNTLLFLSLCLNIFTAYLALWIRGPVSRDFLETRLSGFSPHDRARKREALACEFNNSPALRAIGLMLLLSPLFFFAGLSVYLFNINRAVFGPVLSCICLFCITLFFALRSQSKVKDTANSSTKIDDQVLVRLFKALVKDSDLVQFFEIIPDFCRSSIVDDPCRRFTSLGKWGCTRLWRDY
ncbi:hypothetical protein BGW80DRAFT_275295 [Lactifluus volemus]|nr:hypothetical protein BGW80DRAFT_275295 [Lactifluus volemus]